MQTTVRRAEERGHFDHGWLNTYHTFSFADYYDPRFMGYRTLRVINEDRVKSGMGFGTHGHRDMEILSYVLEGELEHRDSIGNGSTIRPGEVQRMTAGTGVRHSEFNPSRTNGLHFLQIWIVPEREGLTPGYEQKDFGDARRGRLCLIASRDGEEGSVTIHQNAKIYASILDGRLEQELETGHSLWLQAVRGKVSAGGATLEPGDGASIEQPGRVAIEGYDSEFLLFDLA